MSFRQCLFWAHLGCGVVAGLVILMMSVTGVLLTYERQMINWADQRSLPPIVASNQRASLQQIIDSVAVHAPGIAPSGVSFSSDPKTAVAVQLGRGHTVFVDPYSARVLGEGAKGVHGFFNWITQMHRWFAAGEESRAIARAITGAANLLFLFIVLSGMYLWLPLIYRKTQFRMRLLFSQKYKSSKARDFNWHHVFGIWMCVPLALIIASATVFSYGWANDLVYRALGEQPPQRGGTQGGAAAATAAELTVPTVYDDLLTSVVRQAGEWRTITLRLPVSTSGEVSFSVDRGNGGQPQKQTTMTLHLKTGAVIRTENFNQLSPGRQARVIIRRLHTGEVLGIAGQTLAGVASFAAVMLVWTGLALAYRRLIQPWVKRRRAN